MKAFQFFILITTFLVTQVCFSQRTFDTAVEYATSSGSVSLAIGDLNQDGKLDVVAVNGNSNSISVFLNISGGILASKSDYSTGNNPNSVAIGDLNGDGVLDIAVSNWGGGISVLTNSGNGIMGVAVNYSAQTNPSCIAIGDLNSDGNADLVVANSSSKSISVLTNIGNGTFANAVNYNMGTNSGRLKSIALGDFNKDGILDVATCGDRSTVVGILLNIGNGNLGGLYEVIVNSNPIALAIGDINNDNNLDLAVINGVGSNNNSVSVLTNTGNGNFTSNFNYTINSRSWNIAIGDINGDGKLDLVLPNESNNNISIYNNLGNNNFSLNVDFSVGLMPYYVAIGDLNGDDKSDLVVANTGSNSISVLLAKESNFINNFTISNKSYRDIFTLNATATSGLPISYNCSDVNILNIVGNSVTATGVGVVTITAFQNGNTTFGGVTHTGVITVTQANLSITANNFTRTFGVINPIFTGTINGVLNGDIINPTFTTNATPTSGVGNYTITASATGTNIANYQLVTQNGILTITISPNLVGKLKYRNSSINLGYNAASPTQFLPTSIFGINSSGTRNTPVLYTNASGDYAIKMDVSTATGFVRDIKSATRVNTFITASDANRALRIANGSRVVANVYEIISADVDGDSRITSTDATLINRRSAGTINTFPNGVSDWSFEESTRLLNLPQYKPSTSYPNDNGIGFSRSRVPKIPTYYFPTLTGVGNYMYFPATMLGILIGDLDGNFDNRVNSGTRTESQAELIFKLSEAVRNADSSITVPVYLSENSESINWTIAYNQSKISIEKIYFSNPDTTLKLLDWSRFSTDTVLVSTFKIDTFPSQSPSFFVMLKSKNPIVQASDFEGSIVVINETNSTMRVEGLANLTSIESLNLKSESSIYIYPNPVSNGELIVENGTIGDMIYIYNSQGSICFFYEIVSKSTKINTKLSKGIYIVKIGNESKKLVVNF